MEPIGCPETSVTDHQSTSRNIPEEQTSYLHLGEKLKSLFIPGLEMSTDFLL
jgi:hypothetical protein